jgi:hypothetical protein
MSGAGRVPRCAHRPTRLERAGVLAAVETHRGRLRQAPRASASITRPGAALTHSRRLSSPLHMPSQGHPNPSSSTLQAC